jgi:hypothetical protein
MLQTCLPEEGEEGTGQEAEDVEEVRMRETRERIEVRKTEAG